MIKNILYVEQNQDGTVGGSHYCLLYLIQCLDRKKYNPIVMFYEEYDIVEKFKECDCEIIIYNKPKGKKYNKYLVIFQKIYNFINVEIIPILKFIFILKNKNIDLIHLNNSCNIGLAWLTASKILQKKCITHQRGHVHNPKFFSKYFDINICVSNSVKENLTKNNINKCIVIYDGMDPSNFKSKIIRSSDEIRKSYNSLGTPFFGIVGNFQEWKGHDTVVEAVKLLLVKYPNLLCLLVGGVSSTSLSDSIYFNKLKEKVIKEDLKKNIIITGYRSDIPDLINSFDFFIHASIKPEPFGMVLLEAMCLSKPVIATDMGGPREIVENLVSGFLVKPSDSRELSQTIEYLIENKDKRQIIGENARKRVVEKFSLNSFSVNINSLYNKIFTI